MPFTDYAIKISEYRRKASTTKFIDEAIQTLNEKKETWVLLSVDARIELLERLLDDFLFVSESWVQASAKGKGIETSTEFAQEWMGGPYSIVRNLKLLIRSLESIKNAGTPALPGAPFTKMDQVHVPVFPTNFYDRILFRGTTAEVCLQKEMCVKDLPSEMSLAYQGNFSTSVALVLGAGNVSSIGSLDCLYKLFVEKKVVILKMHPVNAYLGALIEMGFRALIKPGFLKIVYGDAVEGDYICKHQGVDEVHITGSDKTHDAIVFGQDPVLKISGRPKLTKPITSELGNVSPMIVSPGQWTQKELDFHAENIVSSLVNNAGFNCNATRVIVTSTSWEQRSAFLDAIRQSLSSIPSRKAYYPGASKRFDAFALEHPDAEIYGQRTNENLPWMFIPGLRPDADDICFREEAFCGAFCEVAVESDSFREYLNETVDFCNEKLWGTLSATLLIHPSLLKDGKDQDSLDTAIANLRYGAVSVNHWSALAYGLGCTTLGAYPGHSASDIQSGQGVVHNTYMLPKVEKTIVRGPFMPWPKPPWFVGHKNSFNLVKALTNFEAEPSLIKLPKILFHALRG